MQKQQNEYLRQVFLPETDDGVLRNMLVLLFVAAAADLSAQRPEFIDAVRSLTGETDIESVDADQMEHFHYLYQHPVDVNKSTRASLESIGLLTPFQIASLIDYRDRHGYILSIVELAAVDGFTEESARRLEPFVILSGHMQKSGNPSGFKGEIAARYGYKADPEKGVCKSTYGIKSRCSFSDRIIVTVAATEPYDSSRAYPTVYSGSLMFQHRAGKVVVGDFNARFGQGLCVWNTASFSSLNSPSVFMKRSSGIAAANSYTGSSALTGVASDLSFGHWKISAALSLPAVRQLGDRPDKFQISPVMNIIRYGRLGHVGCTHMMSFASVLSGDYRIPQMKTSVDGAFCFKGVNLFGECVCDWVGKQPSALVGSEFPIAENTDAAAMLRYLPGSNEHGAAFAVESSQRQHRLQASADGLYHPVSKSKDGSRSYQVKVQLNWIWKISTALQTRIRIAERVRTWGTASRTELRAEAIYEYERWKATLRADGLYGCSYAGLAYAEAGYLAGKVSAYVRFGLFHVDNWDDRIYVYERDAPANFNVPAYYGRGLWTSLYVSYKPVTWCRLYVRGAYKKPGNAELKLYSVLEF